MTMQLICERCGRPVAEANNHRVHLELVNGVKNDSTVLEGDFHHGCAAELFEQFRGRTRGEPLREAVTAA